MALNIKNPEVDRLARQLAAVTGETITAAILRALQERLQRTKRTHGGNTIAEDLAAIRKRCARLPVLDPRPANEILGYDDQGLPT